MKVLRYHATPPFSWPPSLRAGDEWSKSKKILQSCGRLSLVQSFILIFSLDWSPVGLSLKYQSLLKFCLRSWSKSFSSLVTGGVTIGWSGFWSGVAGWSGVDGWDGVEGWSGVDGWDGVEGWSGVDGWDGLGSSGRFGRFSGIKLSGLSKISFNWLTALKISWTSGVSFANSFSKTVLCSTKAVRLFGVSFNNSGVIWLTVSFNCFISSTKSCLEMRWEPVPFVTTLSNWIPIFLAKSLRSGSSSMVRTWTSSFKPLRETSVWLPFRWAALPLKYFLPLYSVAFPWPSW